MSYHVAIALLFGTLAAFLGLVGKSSLPCRPRSVLRTSEADARLDKLVVANFSDVRLQDLVERIGREVGVPIRLDDAALDQEGVAPDTPVTISLAHAVKARTLLALVLEPLGLDCVTRNGTSGGRLVRSILASLASEI